MTASITFEGKIYGQRVDLMLRVSARTFPREYYYVLGSGFFHCEVADEDSGYTASYCLNVSEDQLLGSLQWLVNLLHEAGWQTTDILEPLRRHIQALRSECLNLEVMYIPRIQFPLLKGDVLVA